jgi:YHS domain-containing protein
VLRFLLLLLLFWLIARAFWRLMEGIVRGATSGAQAGAASSSRAPGAVKMSQCPVCGTYVVPGKAISLTQGGQVFYFCGDPHRAEFQRR